MGAPGLETLTKGLTSESRTINDPETLRNGGGIITPPAPLDVPGLFRCLLLKKTSFFFDGFGKSKIKFIGLD